MPKVDRRGHHCHAAGCNALVKPEMLMCLRHWRMVPRPLQQAVWRTYRSGQCDDWIITNEYAEAASAAVRHVAVREGKGEAAIREACLVYEALRPGGEDAEG